ncbi:MAG: hypothetical protein IJ999_00350 [Clostridia bacterium]|nr:hypothetical protein [Clostridia bacterium]
MMYITKLQIKNFGNIREFEQTFEPYGCNVVNVYPEEYEDLILAIKTILSIFPNGESTFDICKKIDYAFGSHGEIVSTFQHDEDVICLKQSVNEVRQGIPYYNYMVSVNNIVLPSNISKAIWGGISDYLYPDCLRKSSLYRFSGKEQYVSIFWPIIDEALKYESSHINHEEKENAFLSENKLLVPRDEVYFNELKYFSTENSYSFCDKGKDLVRFLYTSVSQRTIIRKSEFFGPHPLFVADIDDLLDDVSKIPQEAKDFLFDENGLLNKKGLRQYLIFNRK